MYALVPGIKSDCKILGQCVFLSYKILQYAGRAQQVATQEKQKYQKSGLFTFSLAEENNWDMVITRVQQKEKHYRWSSGNNKAMDC